MGYTAAGRSVSVIVLHYNHVLFVVIAVVNLVGVFSPKSDLTLNLVEEIKTL